VRALVYVQNRDERSQIRPHFSKAGLALVMANSTEELLQHLNSTPAFDMIVLDDSFDAKSSDGAILNPGATLPDILQLLQAGKTPNTDALVLVLLRPALCHNEPGTVSLFIDSAPHDREQSYTELGATHFLERPFRIEALTQSLQDFIKNAEQPAPWLKVLRQLRQFYNHGNYAQVLAMLDKLASTGLENTQLPFALLRARSLAQLGEEHIPASLATLEKLLIKYPKSISTRALRLEGFLKLEHFDEAFHEQLGILALQKTNSNFDKTLALLAQMFDHTLEKKGPENAEELLLGGTRNLIDLLLKDPRPYSKNSDLVCLKLSAKDSKKSTPARFSSIS
jgi:CheY-like chemotaxis protein